MTNSKRYPCTDEAGGARAPQCADTGKLTGPVACWSAGDGGRRVVLENAFFRVVVWPEKGGALTSYYDRERGYDVIWRNPYGHPPRLNPLAQPMRGGSDLYDVMDGSWYVSLPNGFFPADYFGAPLGTHGELRAVPWEVVRMASNDHEASVELAGCSVRTPLVYRRVLKVRRASRLMEWTETVANRCAEAMPVAWLQHPTFSGPLLDGGRLVVPARTVSVFAADDPAGLQLVAGHTGRWPWAPEREGGAMRDCSLVPPRGTGQDHSVQLSDFETGCGCIWNQRMGRGFAMEWDAKLFPHAWSWNSAGGVAHYPLWGEGHIITLQPSTSPVGRFDDLVKRGQVMMIPARGEVSTRLITGFVDQADGPWSESEARS